PAITNRVMAAPPRRAEIRLAMRRRRDPPCPHAWGGNGAAECLEVDGPGGGGGMPAAGGGGGHEKTGGGRDRGVGAFAHRDPRRYAPLLPRLRPGPPTGLPRTVGPELGLVGIPDRGPQLSRPALHRLRPAGPRPVEPARPPLRLWHAPRASRPPPR